MKKRFGVIAMILAVAAMLSIFSLSVFADDTTAATADTTAPTTTTAAPSTTAEPNAFVEFLTTPSQVIPLALLIVAIIVLVVVFFGIPKYREKTFKLFRSLKSECKKISWYSWKNTRKGTVVVIICVVSLAIAIGLLDYLFSTGIIALSKVF